ncbi:OLC1v1007992C2 [Oldenlandia corymbosa var. corymbosa]|uniref:feruloyl-CoA 6-hydroxylase n=1 Tax=Oldenlandia corymbosa var. corymbosa TaxID=529605 RepID=A0AAV1DKK7_OLDCO|nr:OLC1v1007992C2 [Oldenlandia corymbosa var. corymbosa]
MAEVGITDANSLFDFVAKKGYGIKGLVDSGIVEVPPLYIQPPYERVTKKISHPNTNFNHHASVPIDLSKLDGPDNDKVVEAIVRAAETLGFFQVTNHGIDLDLLDSLPEAAHRFFEQPAEVKAGFLKGVSPTPLVKYATSFAPEKEKFLQWRDYINMTYTNDADAEKYWPDVCKRELVEYIKSSHKMVLQLFKILIENLGVTMEESKFESLIGTKVVNMNYYPACPNPEVTIGVKRHSDIGILTVLAQDDIGGLYVKVSDDDDTQEEGKKEEWIEIPPIPSALVVNIGDSLQILSNGKYKSSEHKVGTTSQQSRVSVPIFVTPRLSEKIGPLPQLVERDGGTIYREVVFKDYMNYFFVYGHEGKNALDFAKINYPN